MKTKYIKLDMAAIPDFVAAAEKVQGEVVVKKGCFCIDGASLIGMHSLDLREGCSVSYPADATEFEEYLGGLEC